MSADSFRQLTARLRKPSDAPLRDSRPAPASLDLLASRIAGAKLKRAEPERAEAVPDQPAFTADSDAPEQAREEDPVRDILDAINAAPLGEAPPRADNDGGDPERQAELDRIRAAIFAPLKPFTPPGEAETTFSAGLSPEPAAAGEFVDPVWAPPPLTEPEAAAAPDGDAADAATPELSEPLVEPAAEAPAEDLSDAEPIPEPLAAETDAPAVYEHGADDASAGTEAPAAYEIGEEPAAEHVTEVPEAPAVAEAVEEPAAEDLAAPAEAPAAAVPAVEAVVEEAVLQAAEHAPPEPEAGSVTAESAAPPETAADRPADTAPLALPGEEKAQPSALAGKVVDAMLKTISAAVYAKPTSAERAAFLREMAELMEQAASQPLEDGGTLTAPADFGSEYLGSAASEPAVPEYAEADMQTDAAGEPQPMAAALAERIGAASPILRHKAQTSPDPFAQHTPRALIEKQPEETFEADEESGELALTLLDMMSGGTGSLPHERTLAADTLLRILPRIPVKQLLAVVERVAIMEAPPPLLVAKLIRDTRPEVVGPLLERCSMISDQDLMNAAANSDTAKLRMIARRRVLSTVLSDYLISTGEPAVLLTLIRNPGAALSHEAFFRLASAASTHAALLAPLATRGDLPPPVAFELFWHVPQELRRFIFSRFLTDSENLNRILRITIATHGAPGAEAGSAEGRFPPKEAIEQAVRAATAFKLDDAAQSLAEMAGIARDTVLRILADREGEPFTVLMKMLGCQRARFEELSQLMRESDPPLLRPDRKADDLQAIFDSLSFNKARILITYWDWFVRKAGPYAENA